MAYGTKYRVQFSNRLEEEYYIFLNLEGYQGDIQFITALAGGLAIKSINGDDDIFSPILSKECLISLYIGVGEEISIEDFVAAYDDQWHVVVYRDLNQPPIFEGFIIVESSSQPLHDQPYQLTLRASDGLSLLKTVPLKKINGDNFTGLNAMTEYIGHALYYLNPNINFRVYHDVYHVTMDKSVPAMQQMQVYAKTFEKGETGFEDSYTVLSKICESLQCRLFYENGCWHIVSLWEYYKNYGFNWYEYSVNLGYVRPEGYKKNDSLVARIGKDENIFFVEKDATKTIKLAVKSVQKTYQYDIPQEVVCNQSFVKGPRDLTIGGAYYGPYQSSSIPSEEYPELTNYEGYSIDCWSHHRTAGSFPGEIPSKKAYIMREFDQYFYEKERYAVLENEYNAPDSANLLSEPFYVGKDDRITVSVETRIDHDDGDKEDTVIVFAVLLTGDNGQKYTLNGGNIGQNGVWDPVPDFFGGISYVLQGYTDVEGARKTDWVNVSIDSNKIPVNGSIQIYLNEHSAGDYPNATWFRNLRVEYRPYINGSFKPVKSDYNIYSQEGKINKTIDETVAISDSPKKIIKGALHVNDQLASPQWQFPERIGTYRFTQVMDLMKYNFLHRQYRMIEGSIKGLSRIDSEGNNIPFGFLPQYMLSDLPDNQGSIYILTSMDVNYHSGTWRGVLVEVPAMSLETFDKYDFQYVFE